MSEVREFSTRLKEEPVKIDGQAHTIRELDGTRRDMFISRLGNKMKVNKSGDPVGVKDYTGVHAFLISLSLHKGDDSLYEESVIQGWPGSLQSYLFGRAQKLSGLGKEEETMEDAKND